MIDRALVLLARMRFRAWLRRLRRGLSSPRGMALFVIGLLVMGMWLVPALFRGQVAHRQGDPELVRQAAPLWMLAVTLTMAFFSGGGKIISFSPADIDFLFPGPFSRHQLVLYKIAITAFAAIWAALMFSIWLGRHASLWIAAFTGVWLAWMFAQSLAILILLARKAITARRSSLPVRAGMGLLLLLIFAAVFAIIRPLSGGHWDWESVLVRARDSLPARMVLAPFDVLAWTFTAERIFPDLLQWASLSALMITALIGLILIFDVHFIEAALVASERLQVRLKLMRRGGGALAAARPIARFRIGMLPRLGGAGALAWRQLQTAVRGARGLLVVLILLAVGLGPLLWGVSRQGEHGRGLAVLAPMLAVGGFWLVFLLPSMVRFDFRGDLAHIDTLKLLPLPPSVVAIGQMLVPVTIVTLLVWLLAAIVWAAVPGLAHGGAMALAFAPPMLALVIGIENAIFLMFPAPLTMATPGDMTMLGRTMIVLFLKMLALSAGLGLAAGAGAAAYALSRSWVIALVAAWIVLAGLATATVPVVARLFARFDPSVDKPAE